MHSFVCQNITLTIQLPLLPSVRQTGPWQTYAAWEPELYFLLQDSSFGLLMARVVGWCSCFQTSVLWLVWFMSKTVLCVYVCACVCVCVCIYLYALCNEDIVLGLFFDGVWWLIIVVFMCHLSQCACWEVFFCWTFALFRHCKKTGNPFEALNSPSQLLLSTSRLLGCVPSRMWVGGSIPLSHRDNETIYCGPAEAEFEPNPAFNLIHTSSLTLYTCQMYDMLYA